MSENNHPINEVLQTTMSKVKEMVDANTVVGQPITTQDGVTLIPVSRLSFGFATGGSDMPTSKPKDLFGGGSGGGVTISPIAFIVISPEGEVRMMQVSEDSNNTARALNMIPDVINQVVGFFNKKKNGEGEESGNKEEKQKSVSSGEEKSES